MPNERQPFSPKGDFVAGSHGLRFAGKSYAPGAEFPSRRLACPPRRLKQLYERRLLEYADGFDVDKARADAVPVEEEVVEIPITLTFTFDPEKHSVNEDLQIIDEEGEVQLEVDKALAKKLKKAKKPVEIDIDEE